jgi:AcrR family transcriptional regulator
MPAEERRELLHAAALDEFARRGFHATQMEHVAAAAGVSKALIYQHFESKEVLFAAVTEQLIEEFASRLPGLLAVTDDPLAAWRSVVHLIVDLVSEKPTAWSLVVRHLFDAEGGDPLREMWDVLNQGFAALMLTFYAPEPGQPRIPEADQVRAANVTVSMLIGGLQGLLAWWAEHPEVSREEIEHHAVEFPWLGLDRQRRGETLI